MHGSDGEMLDFHPFGPSACPVIGHPLRGLASTIPTLLVKDEKLDLALYVHFAIYSGKVVIACKRGHTGVDSNPIELNVTV